MSKNNISYTAWIVMRCMVALNEEGRWPGLLDAEQVKFYRFCVDYCGRHALFFRLQTLFPARWTARGTEICVARGIALHFVLRKKMIAEQVELAIAQGMQQLVVLGGGFDRLSMDMARKYPHLRAFEIDRPGMNAHKHEILAEYLGALPANLSLIPADLAKRRLTEVLKEQAGFSAGAPTVFLAEGISMYLTHQEFTDLLAEMRHLSPGGSFIFTAIGDQSERKRRLSTGIGNRILAWVGESFRFGMNPENMAEFLSAHHYRMQALATFDELQEPYRNPRELKRLKRQNGEYGVVAQIQ